MKSTLVEELGLKQIDKCPTQYQDFVWAIKEASFLEGASFFSDLVGFHYVLSTITINLPSHGPYEDLDIRRKEEVLFLLYAHYPYQAPKVTINRTDFPFPSLPHVNMPFYIGDRLFFPQTLCLHRGNINEWFFDAGPEQFLHRTREWLKDAAKGELVKDDGFEPMMRLEWKHSIIYDLNSIHQLMATNPKPPVILYRNILDIINDERDSIVRVDIHASYKNASEYVPCLILFDGAAPPTAKYLGHHNNRLRDFWGLMDSALIQRGVRVFNNNHYSASILLRKFLLIYGVRRPQPLIGSSSDIELINCLVELPEYSGKFNITGDESCFLLNHINSFGPVNAAGLSASSSLIDKKLALLGCGALGSKISLSLARMGVIQQTLIDKDKMLPHNLTRHALQVYSDGSGRRFYKSDLMASTIDFLYETNSSRSCPKDILDVSCDELNTQDYVVDCTASGIVLDYLASAKTIMPRVFRAEIAHEGHLGLMFFEGPDRIPDLRELRNILYYQAMHDDVIYRWLQHDKDNISDFAHQEFQVGLGCSSDTMILDDAVISAHASVATSIIKSLEATEPGFIYVNEYHENNLTRNSVKKFEADSFEVFVCNNWNIKMKCSLLRRIHLLAKDDSENGGIFIGNIHARSKTVLILDIHVPEGNQRSPSGLVRGDVKNYMEHLEERTCGLISYVGEWHTHPRMASTKMSSIDRSTFTLLKGVLGVMQLPVVHGIFNEQNYDFYLFECD